MATIRITLASADETVTTSFDVDDDRHEFFDVALTARQKDKLHTVSLPGSPAEATGITSLKLAYILCDEKITIKTNSPDTPDTQWTIEAGCPWTWWQECLGAFAGFTDEHGTRSNTPWDIAVTKFYFTNHSTNPTTVYCRFITDED